MVYLNWRNYQWVKKVLSLKIKKLENIFMNFSRLKCHQFETYCFNLFLQFLILLSYLYLLQSTYLSRDIKWLCLTLTHPNKAKMLFSDPRPLWSLGDEQSRSCGFLYEAHSRLKVIMLLEQSWMSTQDLKFWYKISEHII